PPLSTQPPDRRADLDEPLSRITPSAIGSVLHIGDSRSDAVFYQAERRPATPGLVAGHTAATGFFRRSRPVRWDRSPVSAPKAPGGATPILRPSQRGQRGDRGHHLDTTSPPDCR